MLPGPGKNTPHTLELSMHILGGLNRLVEHFAPGGGNRLRARILNQIRFARLGNQRQRERIDRLQAAGFSSGFSSAQ